MLSKEQLKAQGLVYARSLQMVLKTIGMFSSDHKVAASTIERNYNLLNALLKETRQFTIGFVERRLMLNNLLTTDPNLAPLENELLRRGIGAITFEAGLTQQAYRRVIGIIGVNHKIIEQAGGLLPYLQQYPIDLVRIFPARKDTLQTKDGDTILETDSESYLMSKALSDTQRKDPVEMLLQEMGAGGSYNGGGPVYGGVAVGTGMSGYSPAIGGVYAPSRDPGSFGPVNGSIAPEDTSSGPRWIQNMVNTRLDALSDAADVPQQAYLDLARALRDLRPDFVLSMLPTKRQQELSTAPAPQEQMTTEVLEDTTVRWAYQRLASAPTGEAVIVEEHVIKVLIRCLQHTQTAARLAKKLSDYVTEFSIPQSTVTRVQDELTWVTLPLKQKTTQLLQLVQFSATDFKHLLDLIREAVKLSNFELATQLASHYFDTFDPVSGPQPEELGRIPDLLRMMAGARTEFWPKAASHLWDELNREPFQQFRHVQVINGLVLLTKTVAVYEDWQLVLSVGNALERNVTRDPQLHSICCKPALQNLLNPISAERLVEIFLEKKDDAEWNKTAAALLRWSGQDGIERAFVHLEEESLAANRLALLRLIGRVGPLAMETARQRLGDSRWYVVRNACRVLGALKRPELLTDLAPALAHEDERVQKAAIQSILESRLPGRGAPLAEALPHMSPYLQEETLGELFYLKDSRTLPALAAYVQSSPPPPSTSILKVFQILSAINDTPAREFIYEILANKTNDISVRRTALNTLKASYSPHSARLLAQFSREVAEDDPLK